MQPKHLATTGNNNVNKCQIICNNFYYYKIVIKLLFYQTGCGPFWFLAQCHPEVFQDEIQFCNTTVFSAGSLWGESNPPSYFSTASPQVWGVLPAAWDPPQDLSAEMGTRCAQHHLFRARSFQLHPGLPSHAPPGASVPERVKFSGEVRWERSCVEAYLVATVAYCMFTFTSVT